MGSRRLLADHRVRCVLVALVASSWANGILPVTESFAVLQVTGSAGKLGIVLACQGAVVLLLSLAGGLAGDRFPHGRILIASSVVRMAVAATLSVTLLTHTASFGVLLAGAVGYGAAGGFFGPVSTAMLPDIVRPEQLAAANAVLGGPKARRLLPGDCRRTSSLSDSRRSPWTRRSLKPGRCWSPGSVREGKKHRSLTAGLRPPRSLMAFRS